MTTMTKKAATKFRRELFATKVATKDGFKKIGDLTANELEELERRASSRANLLRLVREQIASEKDDAQ